MINRIATMLTVLSALILATATADAAAVVEIAGRTYDSAGILAVMKANGLEMPDQAIQRIKQEAAIKALGGSEEGLYQQAFGESLKKDRARAEAKDLPLISKRAGTRLYMFEIWLNEKACAVPVRYLDMAAYWKIVQDTEGYKVRAEAGHAPDPSDMAYTFAELALPAQQVLALRENKPFLTGSEFNAYITENYDELHTLIKRRNSLAKVRNALIQKIASEKIALEMEPPGAEELVELEIERAVHAFVERHFLDAPLELSGSEHLSPSDMLEDLYLAYTRKHREEIDQLRAALSDGGRGWGLSDAQRRHLQREKLKRLKAQLARGLDDDQIYRWMQRTRFPSTVEDARLVVTDETHEAYLEEGLRKNRIVLNAVK